MWALLTTGDGCRALEDRLSAKHCAVGTALLGLHQLQHVGCLQALGQLRRLQVCQDRAAAKCNRRG